MTGQSKIRLLSAISKKGKFSWKTEVLSREKRQRIKNSSSSCAYSSSKTIRQTYLISRPRLKRYSQDRKEKRRKESSCVITWPFWSKTAALEACSKVVTEGIHTLQDISHPTVYSDINHASSAKPERHLIH